MLLARRGLQAALAAALCMQALAAFPAWYTCDPATCGPPGNPDCACASISPPGGLAPEDTPQFIMITHDDAISALTNQVVRSVIDKHTNRNGCNVPATFFVLEVGTRCELAQAFYEQNSEIAIHSKTHAMLKDPFPGGEAALAAEMLSARKFLNETCGIPLDDMVGFRAPYLMHNPPVREVLEANGFLYDSSMEDFWGENSDISPNSSAQLWPYTMDSGIPVDCAYFLGNQCLQNETYPGLWEVPVHVTQSDNGTLLYSMDPGVEGGTEGPAGSNVTGLPPAELTALLKQNFLYSYNSNRSPFGVWLHTPWFTDNNVQGLNDFLEWALALNNTWAVTVRQVIEWMQDPVPASEMDEWLKCKPVDLSKAPGVAKCQLYTVKEGDTGEAIAVLFGVSVDDLKTLNPKLESLMVGDKLKIPPFDASCGAGVPTTGPAGGSNTAVGGETPSPPSRRLLRQA